MLNLVAVVQIGFRRYEIWPTLFACDPNEGTKMHHIILTFHDTHKLYINKY